MAGHYDRTRADQGAGAHLPERHRRWSKARSRIGAWDPFRSHGLRGRMAPKERIVVSTPNTASARQCREGHLPADPLRVGLIRVELESGEVEVLITSLLDTKAYPYRAFAKHLCATLGHRGELQAGKATPGDREFFRSQSKRLGCYCWEDFHAKIFAAPSVFVFQPFFHLTAIFVRLAQWLADARYQHRRHGYRINFANALSKMKNNLVRLFLETSPLDLSWRLLQAYGRCGSSCAPRTQVPERHEKSPSPRIPDAVSKNTVRLKLMTLNLSPHTR